VGVGGEGVVQDGMVARVDGGQDLEGDEKTDEGGVEFAVGKVRADAHAAAGAVGVVRRADGGAGVGVVAVGCVEVVPVWVEGVWVVEVCGVVVGGIRVLYINKTLGVRQVQ
jgi:hypothetical protein